MSYTVKNLDEVADIAPKHGFGDTQEARFANDDYDAKDTGFSLHRIRPGKRQGFAHRHENAEEVYVVLGGSGRIKLDDDVVDLERLDAVRVAPTVARAFEAGDEGLEIIAFGPRHEGDGELIENPEFWT